jgi:hypothetical protein
MDHSLLPSSIGSAWAQENSAGPASFKPEELEALVAPIALYPDSVLAQALMASTYPLEVVQAARWVKANPNVKGMPPSRRSRASRGMSA